MTQKLLEFQSFSGLLNGFWKGIVVIWIVKVKIKNILASKSRTNCSTFLGMVPIATSNVKTSKRVNLKNMTTKKTNNKTKNFRSSFLVVITTS